MIAELEHKAVDDRVTQEVTPQGIVHYTYDAISQRLTMRANAQPPVTYGYDANSQLSNVTQGTLSATLTHDALGRRTQLQRCPVRVSGMGRHRIVREFFDEWASRRGPMTDF